MALTPPSGNSAPKEVKNDYLSIVYSRAADTASSPAPSQAPAARRHPILEDAYAQPAESWTPGGIFSRPEPIRIAAATSSQEEINGLLKKAKDCEGSAKNALLRNDFRSATSFFRQALAGYTNPRLRNSLDAAISAFQCYRSFIECCIQYDHYGEAAVQCMALAAEIKTNPAYDNNPHQRYVFELSVYEEAYFLMERFDLRLGSRLTKQEVEQAREECRKSIRDFFRDKSNAIFSEVRKALVDQVNARIESARVLPNDLAIHVLECARVQLKHFQREFSPTQENTARSSCATALVVFCIQRAFNNQTTSVNDRMTFADIASKTVEKTVDLSLTKQYYDARIAYYTQKAQYTHVYQSRRAFGTALMTQYRDQQRRTNTSTARKDMMLNDVECLELIRKHPRGLRNPDDKTRDVIAQINDRIKELKITVAELEAWGVADQENMRSVVAACRRRESSESPSPRPDLKIARSPSPASPPSEPVRRVQINCERVKEEMTAHSEKFRPYKATMETVMGGQTAITLDLNAPNPSDAQQLIIAIELLSTGDDRLPEFLEKMSPEAKKIATELQEEVQKAKERAQTEAAPRHPADSEKREKREKPGLPGMKIEPGKK